MAEVAIVEVIVRCRDDVLEADAHADPPHELLDLQGPLHGLG